MARDGTYSCRRRMGARGGRLLTRWPSVRANAPPRISRCWSTGTCSRGRLSIHRHSKGPYMIVSPDRGEKLESSPALISRPEDFQGLKVVVVGFGNTAGDTATFLVGHAAKVYLAHRHGSHLVNSSHSISPPLWLTRQLLTCCCCGVRFHVSRTTSLLIWSFRDALIR